MIISPNLNQRLLKALALAMLALTLVTLSGQPLPVIRAQENPSLLFVENAGQFPDAHIRFQVNIGQATLRLTENALWLTVLEEPHHDLMIDPQTQPETGRGVNLKLTFANANPAPQLEPFNPLNQHISYFTGREANNWQSQVSVWGGVRYVDLYPGLDLEITSHNGQLVQRMVLKNEVDAQTNGTSSLLADVRLQVEGANAIALSDTGGLRLNTAIGDITLPLPQIVTADGATLPVAPPEIQDFAVVSPFATDLVSIASSTDAAIAATDDLIYSTFIGGSYYFDSSQDIAIDDAGYAYLTGRAYTGFPSTPGVFDPTIEGFFNDAFIAKLTPDGSGLVYATFLGGDAYETTYAIAVNEAGEATVAGHTGSTDFPVTPGAFDNSLSGDSDAFVAKINGDGTALLYATLVGGNNVDYCRDVALDEGGQAYVTGFTRSTDFPTTPDALAPDFNGGFSDSFAVKVAADGSDLTYATYLGGSESESGYGIAVDGSGSAYLTGYTGSADFPTTPDGFDTSHAVSDAYVVKLNPTGSAVAHGTFLGGSLVDSGRAITLDSTGVYITGRTDSADFPATPDAYDTGYNSADDAFVAKLSLDLNGLFYATFLGGSNSDEGQDLAVDAAGSVYVTGLVYSEDFPTTPDAFATSCPGCSPYHDVFIAKINPNGTGLVYGTYLGGVDHDESFGLAQDGLGHVYVTGDTKSSDFPTTSGAFDTTLNGYGKGFVTKLFVGTGVGPPPPAVPEHTCSPTLLDTFTVQTEPRGLAIDSTRQRLYVANFGSHSVSVVDTTNDHVLQTISGIDSANGITFDPTRNLIWVTNYDTGQVTPIQANSEATDFTVLSPVDVGNRPWGVVYDPVHDYVYVVNYADDSVSVIDAGTQSLVVTLTDSFNRPFHLTVNPITGKVYVANSGHNTSSVTVIDGTSVSRVIELGDSIRAYGIAVDETRDLVYVATTYTNRIVVIGSLNGQPDQFLGWAAFQRGYNRQRPIPLRAIAVNPQMGPAFDGGHVWATTATRDGSEVNQVLLIPKGWSSRFHVPFAQNVSENPTESIVIDQTTNRIYVSGGIAPGLVTVLGDHDTICGGIAPAAVPDEADQITFDMFILENVIRSDVNKDNQIDIFDLARVASRYHSNDSVADVNGDGTVDIFDLTIVAGNYGQKLSGFGR